MFYFFSVLVDLIINDVFGSCYGLMLKIAKATSPPRGAWGRSTRNVGGAKDSHTLLMMSHQLRSISPATRSRSSLSVMLFGKTGLSSAAFLYHKEPTIPRFVLHPCTNPPRCDRLQLPSARSCLFSAPLALKKPPLAGKTCLMFVVFECVDLADILSLWCCNPVTKYVLYLLLGIHFLASVALNYNHFSVFFFSLQALEQEMEMM